jgi:4-hydroxy-3-polyprenylbenzoate decarboxylase
VSVTTEQGRGPYRDLREWLQAAADINELRTVLGAHWDREIGALTDMMPRRADPCPALLFDEIPGYPPGHRVLSNALASPKRLALTFGLPDDLVGVDLVDAWRKRARSVSMIPPIEVEQGPILENVMTGSDVDLNRFPSPIWHEEDGGRYLGTGCIAISRDPDSGWVNAGTYRMMVHDADKLGIMRAPNRHASIHEQKYFARGEPFPIAVSVGHDPLLLVAGAAPFAAGVGELDWAGGVKGTPVEVVRGPYSKLPIPASAEIVIEGEILPGESLPEGPFGEFTGYYASGRNPEPFIRVKSILYRDDPIILGVSSGRPPTGTHLMNTTTRCAITWNALEAAGVPGICGVWHLQLIQFCVIAIRPQYPGHAKQAALMASQAPGTVQMGRYVVVVEDDIDITDWRDVLWAITTRVDPERDIDIVRNCWSISLDPIIPPDRVGLSSRAIIDATRPYHWRNKFPRASRVSSELELETESKWGTAFFASGGGTFRTPQVRNGVESDVPTPNSATHPPSDTGT